MVDLSPTRRDLIGAVAGMSVLPAARLAHAATLRPEGPTMDVALKINGSVVHETIEPRTTLLDFLREQAALTGTKKGCDMGSCGACTVHIDGKRVLACLTLAARCQDLQITTIEGLGSGEQLHPMQAAFVAHDAMQCGYCTPGQIMSAVALVNEGNTGSDDEIREWMSGNICRCGAYPNIVAAIRDVADHTPRG